MARSHPLKPARDALAQAVEILHFGGGQPVTAVYPDDLSQLSEALDRAVVVPGLPADLGDLLRSQQAILQAHRDPSGTNQGQFTAPLDRHPVVERMYNDLRHVAASLKAIPMPAPAAPAVAPVPASRPRRPQP